LEDRDTLVERQKHCDKTILNSISQELEMISASNPDLGALEHTTANLPKGFEDVVEGLRDLKEPAARRIAELKQLQQKTLDLYHAVAVLRAFYQHQPQAFNALLLQLRK
jgi:hypothetical protein